METIIAGGGITGLTTALALQKMGINCKVYEKAPAIAPVGAGIVMSPNAMKVFEWLGIENDIKKNGAVLHAAVISNRQLVPLRAPKTSYISDQNLPMVAMHRAALHTVLMDHLKPGTLQLNAPLQAVNQKENHVEITIGNQTITTPVLLAADGIHSVVRKTIFPEATLRYSGQTCWRGIARYHIPNHLKGYSTESWGNKRRFGMVNVGENMVYWFAVINAPEHFTPPVANIKDYLKSVFTDFHEDIGKMIDRTELEHIIHSDLSDLNRLNTWHKGNICLLGDAAHATTPNMGQGGAQGVEDAYYIAQCLVTHKVANEAFTAFEKMRRKKVDMIVNNSWSMGQMIHQPFKQMLLRWALSITPAKTIEKQMKQVYEVASPFANA